MGNEDEVKVLFVDDEPNVLRALERLFMDEEYTILQAPSGEEGLRLLEENEPISLVVSDYRMPGMNGVEFLRTVYERWPETVRIVLSGYADTAAVVEAINEGHIYKFIPKPWNDDELRVTIAKAVEVYYLRRENTHLTEELRQTNEQLMGLNEELEQRVKARTGEVIFQNRVLKRSQHILDSLPVAVFGFDDQFDLVQHNRQAYDFVGAGIELALGHPATKVLPAPLVDFLQEIPADRVLFRRVVLAGQEICVKGTRVESEDGQRGVILVVDRTTCGA
ncbi:MAG: response regulator [Thermodesulfobacteriota bacterium]